MSEEKRIYFDYAAATPVDERVRVAMEPYWRDGFGNPGGLYKEGVAAKKAVEEAREKIAALLGARPDEIIFTSGGTEANNLAILGVFQKLIEGGNMPDKLHFVTSAIEHASALGVFHELENRGARVSYVGVTREGAARTDELKESLRPETALVSILYANNEIGTVQPIPEISKLLRNFRKNNELRIENYEKGNIFPLFHCDASNVPSYLPMSVQKLGVDMATLDAQKIYGPKGVGALFVKKGTPLAPLFYSGGTSPRRSGLRPREGGQERRLRPGTEPVPLIAGFAKALEIAVAEREKEVDRLTELRDYFIAEVQKKIPSAELNGDPKKRLPNNVNFSFLGHESEWLALQLDAKSIAAGTRSACLTQKGDGSYVVAALGKGDGYANSALRFTLGRGTAKKDVERTVDVLKQIFAKRDG